MKAKLKYPIFEFSPHENIVYIFWEENQTTQLAILKKADGWKGIHGFTAMCTRRFAAITESKSTMRKTFGNWIVKARSSLFRSVMISLTLSAYPSSNWKPISAHETQ